VTKYLRTSTSKENVFWLQRFQFLVTWLYCFWAVVRPDHSGERMYGRAELPLTVAREQRQCKEGRR
jgi:hypothetical protein